MSNNPSGAIHPTVFMAFWAVSSFGLQSLWPLNLPELALSEWSGRIVIVLGGLLIVWAQTVFRRHGTTALITSGPFRFSRNPIYLALILIFTGLSLAYGNAWGLIMTIIFLIAVVRFTIRPEEEYLEREFGADYSRYRSSVRRWL
jgi:protein-S-isoprenylcysteine O-methyltransferase Ste14